ncbi:hypothetical protein B0H13DRAFT_1897051 [Mycena leptocephala]|nr:hypothetical protein B0H13DRAFT_1897051 [Mycena leptocephala]
MPVGRPRLEPETKRERRRESQKKYEEKQVQKFSTVGNIPHVFTSPSSNPSGLSSARAAIADGDFKTRYKYRQKGAESSNGTETGSARGKQEAEDLRKKHKSVVNAPAAPRPVAKHTKVQIPTPMPAAHGRIPFFPTISATAAADDNDSDDDYTSAETAQPLAFHPGIRACAKCHEEGCPGRPLLPKVHEMRWGRLSRMCLHMQQIHGFG